ncbi:MAG: hypothetical protein GQ564_22565 [Bacteroidales bacterium]|nr:hypothetical protein [Bacteroidales bacterium]
MIQESKYIERVKPGESEFDFESLRKEGISLLQELSGKIWTDYNLHDPGVTILEQLIYALTELIYLTDFDVKDIITSKNGEIDYKKMALYKPLEIFPSETITHNDYCKSIVDKIDGIRNVWVNEKPNGKEKGLYSFLIDVEKKFMGSELQIIEKIRKYYNANRNLCEDIDTIEVLEREPVEICAIIEINNNKTPNDILAEIFFKCFEVICPRMVFHSYKELTELGLSLDEILSGPEINNGYIKDDELLPPKTKILVSELMKEVFQIDGVESIIEFYVEKDGKKYRTELDFSNDKISAYIKLPLEKRDLKIRLLRNDRASTIVISDVLRIFYQLNHDYKTVYNTAQDISDLCQLPKGDYVKFDAYYSLQNHFPAIYGINQYGVPGSASPERKAKAKQLKGYLLLFEQIMANFLTQLENTKELFSIDQDLNATYFTKALTDIPGIRDLLADDWKDNKELHDKQLKEIIARYDNFYERRNRVLDFILAMYGEKFTQKTFREFNYYYTPKEIPKVISDNKIFLLKYLVRINRYKAHSFDYLNESWNTFNIPMIKLKVSLLLGLRDLSQVAYSDVLANYNFELIDKHVTGKCSDCIYKRKEWNVDLDNDYIKENFSNIPLSKETEDIEQTLITDIAKTIDYLKDGAICETFFRYGINLEYYRIGRLKRRKDYTVVFKHPKYNDYIYIGDFKQRERAVFAINCLQQFLVKLNQQSEGIHIVEHILLRQENPDYVLGCHIVNDEDEKVFSTTKDYYKIEIEHLIEELRTVLHNHDYYTIEELEDHLFNINLWKDGKRILKGHKQFESVEDAEASIDRCTDYFKNLHELNTIHEKIKPIKFFNVPADFYPFQISIVLPAWSARFNNLRFRDYVEETFRLNLPAHIYPNFYWLDIYALNRFEKMHHDWMEFKAANDSERTDEYSGRIIRFLLENQQIKKK